MFNEDGLYSWAALYHHVATATIHLVLYLILIKMRLVVLHLSERYIVFQ